MDIQIFKVLSKGLIFGGFKRLNLYSLRKEPKLFGNISFPQFRKQSTFPSGLHNYYELNYVNSDNPPLVVDVHMRIRAPLNLEFLSR